ncbi:MAG: hypothetical protein ACRBN8_45770 [Nannocystales bacterium]
MTGGRWAAGSDTRSLKLAELDDIVDDIKRDAGPVAETWPNNDFATETSGHSLLQCGPRFLP